MLNRDKYELLLSGTWARLLEDEFDKTYMKELDLFLESINFDTFFPERSKVFESLNMTCFKKVKVVILGQDPYLGEGLAHGLAFSVKKGKKIPPSLKNIYKEIRNDIGVKDFSHGYLGSWAEQGVLLLNSVLTVGKNRSNSHRNKGWEVFTDKIINLLNAKNNIVFILWGKNAAIKGKNIDTSRHLILKSAHPSPLSAYRGFFGNKHFSQCNNFLIQKGIKPIDWKV